MQRLEQSENRHEELSGSVSAATRPLLRQIESLQASLGEAQSAGERVERSLSERLQQATIQLAAAQERERTAAEQYMQVNKKCLCHVIQFRIKQEQQLFHTQFPYPCLISDMIQINVLLLLSRDITFNYSSFNRYFLPRFQARRPS